MNLSDDKENLASWKTCHDFLIINFNSILFQSVKHFLIVNILNLFLISLIGLGINPIDIFLVCALFFAWLSSYAADSDAAMILIFGSICFLFSAIWQLIFTFLIISFFSIN